jgi:hypothetical protein
MRRSSADRGRVEAVPMPRDVEAVEAVIKVLDRGVADALDAHCKTTATLVDALGLAYGAVWLPGDDGAFHLEGESGELTGAFGATAGGRVARLTADDGYGGAAMRTKQAIVLDETTPPGACLRWAGALATGARSGCLLPFVEDGRLVAMYEYYTRAAELPFFGARQEKWSSLSRLLSHACKAALATVALQETVDDRVAVTTVVGGIGAAPDQNSALRVALDTLRTAFGWAYGSHWALDPVERVLRFQQESGSAGEEFAGSLSARASPRAWASPGGRGAPGTCSSSATSAR